jgi:hypothetical protein
MALELLATSATESAAVVVVGISGRCIVYVYATSRAG